MDAHHAHSYSTKALLFKFAELSNCTYYSEEGKLKLCACARLGSDAQNFKNQKHENAKMHWTGWVGTLSTHNATHATLWWSFCWVNNWEGSLEGVGCIGCRWQRNVGSRVTVTSFITFAQQVWFETDASFSNSLSDALITHCCLWFISLTTAFIRLNIKWEHQAASLKKRWSTCHNIQSSADLQNSMVSHLHFIRWRLRSYQ